MAGRCAFGPSVLAVNRELVRKVRGQGRLVVHSGMERDVGLLRLYPGIPATLVGTPAQPPRCLPPVPLPSPPSCHWDLHPLRCLLSPFTLFVTWACPRGRHSTGSEGSSEAEGVWPWALLFLVAALVVPAVHPLATSCSWGGHGACLHPAQ